MSGRFFLMGLPNGAGSERESDAVRGSEDLFKYKGPLR